MITHNFTIFFGAKEVSSRLYIGLQFTVDIKE